MQQFRPNSSSKSQSNNLLHTILSNFTQSIKIAGNISLCGEHLIKNEIFIKKSIFCPLCKLFPIEFLLRFCINFIPLFNILFNTVSHLFGFQITKVPLIQSHIKWKDNNFQKATLIFGKNNWITQIFHEGSLRKA